MSALRSTARLFIPPIFLKLGRSLVRQFNPFASGQGPFEGPYTSWEQAVALSDGWDASAIADKTLAVALKARDGAIEYEQDGMARQTIEYSRTILAFIALAVSRNRARLDIIDFGGSLGTNFRQNRRILQALSSTPFTWNVVERPKLAKLGMEHFASPELMFYDSLADALKSKKETPRAFLFSGSLQYVDEPLAAIEQVFRAGATTIAFDRLLVSTADHHAVFIQRPNPDIYYKATYPVWCFSKDLFIKHLTLGGYQLVEQFPLNPEALFDHCGMVFTRLP